MLSYIYIWLYVNKMYAHMYVRAFDCVCLFDVYMYSRTHVHVHLMMYK